MRAGSSPSPTTCLPTRRVAAERASNLEWRQKTISARMERDAAIQRAEKAESEAAARLKQFLTQVEIHTKNTREWRVALDESAAHCLKLRGAIQEAIEDDCDWCAVFADILAATPAASLAAHDRAVKVAILREVAKKLQPTGPSPIGPLFGAGLAHAADWLSAEADRLQTNGAEEKV